ncbi:hypothetical protein [Cryobacterium sp. Y57]|uniref:hypothetical protein n=1 Tax=Cryobacterium sp. Y57 TaxID=2048287 RepID=UPI000CE3518D|nr:hypothetical protein [Cryobacterium sp. Y57]
MAAIFGTILVLAGLAGGIGYAVWLVRANAEVGPWAFVLLGIAVLVPFDLVRVWHNRRVTAQRQH